MAIDHAIGTATKTPEYVFPRDLGRTYPVLVRGEGVYVFDEDGNRYLDAMGGVAVVNIGHGVREIADAMAEQARTLAFSHSVMFSNRPMLDLAERVTRLTPRGLDSVYFVSGGSEANETAIKLARQYHVERGAPSKALVIGRWQSYHGATLGALSVSGHVGRRKKYVPLLKEFPHIAAPNCYRCAFEHLHPACGVASADELERTIIQHGPENVAAFIAEPITGASSGAVVPPPDYFPRIREICDAYDVLLIADEVITGFGRTGTPFAMDHWGVVPDMITTAKGMASGYASLAAVIVHDRIRSVFAERGSPFVHGFTYGGNPLACAVGVAVLDLMERDGLIERSRKMGSVFFRAAERVRTHPIVGDIRGRGLMMGIELVRDRVTKEPFRPELRVAERLAAIALEKGLYVYPGAGGIDGVRGDHILICPPFVIAEHEIDAIFELLDRALGDLESALS